MKKILMIILSLVIVGVIGYVIYLIVFQENSGSSATTGEAVDLSTGGQAVSEWREENRTGISAETGLLKSWPAEEPRLIWMNNELPKGHSSVTFGNNSIYLTGNDDENDILISLDAYGKIKWQTPYGRMWKASHPESRCSPTVEGDRVYVSSGFGDLACIDGTTGKILWSVKASEINKGTYGSWGIAESLIIDGEKIYYTSGGPETMTIALNKADGGLIWRTESLNVPASYCSPVLIDYNDYKLLVNVSPIYVYGVDVTDGTIVWKINHHQALGKEGEGDDGQILCVTPVYKDNKIYFTGGYNHGSLLIELVDNGRKASVKWTNMDLDVHHGGVVLIDGFIYGSNWINNGNGNWCCVDWNTGKTMWEQHWKCKGSIIYADGLLYIYDEKTGFAGLLKPDPGKFDLVSNFRIKAGSGPYWAHPVIHNGVLYLRHGEALMAYDIKEK